MKGKIIAMTLLATIASSVSVSAMQNANDNARGGTYYKYESYAPAYMGTVNTDIVTKQVARDYATFRYWSGPTINISARDTNNKQISNNVSVASNQSVYHSRYYSDKPPTKVYMKFNAKTSSGSSQKMNLSWSPDDPS